MMNIDPRFEQQFREMTEADRQVILQCGRLYAHKILVPVGLVKQDYLTPDDLRNLNQIHDMYGRNIPNVVLQAATTYALAELISVGLAEPEAVINVERFFTDLIKAEGGG